jgi:hypothetical protein
LLGHLINSGEEALVKTVHASMETREEAFKDWCMEAMGRISVHLPSHMLVTTVINLFNRAENDQKEDELYE